MSLGAYIKKRALTSMAIMLVLGLITIILGFATGSYRGVFLTSTLGGIVVASSTAYLLVVALKDPNDPKKIAKPAMQSIWISTSMGLGYLVSVYGPYFNIPTLIATLLFIIGLIILVFGSYTLVFLSRKTGVPIEV